MNELSSSLFFSGFMAYHFYLYFNGNVVFFYSFGHILFWMVVVVVVVVLVICRRGALSWMTNWKLLVLVGNYIIGTLEFSIFDIFCED